MSEEKTFPCFQCEKNGYPNTPIVLAGKDARGNPIRQEPGTHLPHKHKTKLANDQQHQQVPMTPPLSGQPITKEQSIQAMHDENQQGYAEYRQILREQVDATRFLGEAIIELARAFRDKGAVRTEEEGKF